MKLDEDLYDYYGRCFRTYEDEKCVEIMEDILGENFRDRDFRISYGGRDFKISDAASDFKISDADEDLLIEYAPKLFNTLDIKNVPPPYFGVGELVNKELATAMRRFVNEFYHYRYFTDPEYFDNEYNRLLSKHSSNKNIEKKGLSLQNHIHNIIELMGGRPSQMCLTDNCEINSVDITALKRDLLIIQKYPELFIPKKAKKPQVPTDRVEKYLKKLKLLNKSETIKCFIQAIK